MGFRCPSCKADFGNNQDEFKEHVSNSNDCKEEYMYQKMYTEIEINHHSPKKKKTIRVKSPKNNNPSINHVFRKINMVTCGDGWDRVECIRCGLKAKRNFNEFDIDQRQKGKINNCKNERTD